MKTKVKIRVVKDSISKNGRMVTLSVTTNNQDVNNTLGSPFEFTKTYPLNIKLGKLKQALRAEISSTVNSAKQRIEDEGLTDFEVEV